METSSSTTDSIGVAEGLLLEPFQSAFRVVYGFVVLPAMAAFEGGLHPQGWTLAVLFIAALLLLRLIPIAFRTVLPFSSALKAAWFNQRQTAKHFDSYQWAKLLWIGLGMGAYVASMGRLHGQEVALALVCIFGGLLGTFQYRHRIAAAARVTSDSRLEPHNAHANRLG